MCPGQVGDYTVLEVRDFRPADHADPEPSALALTCRAQQYSSHVLLYDAKLDHWRLAAAISVSPPAARRPATWTAAGSSAGEPRARPAVRHVSLSYTVPVRVAVDLQQRQVARVIVVDEAVNPDPSSYVADHDTDPQLPADHPAVVDGYAIADSPDIEWPMWQHGW